MKRVILLILLVMLVAWIAARESASRPRSRPRVDRTPTQVTVWTDARSRSEARRIALQATREAREAVRQAHQEARQALAEARHEVHQALAEAGRDVRGALREANDELRGAGDELREAGDELRESVEGIPVPIVAGTRVEQALPQPPAPPELPECPLTEEAPSAAPAPPAPPAAPGFPGLAKKQKPGKAKIPAPPAPPVPAPGPGQTGVVNGLVSATEERARDEARKALDTQVRDWLAAEGVPPSWQPPRRLVDAMVLQTKVEPVVKDYGTVYLASLTVDVSPARRAGLVHAYQQQLVHRRMALLGGALAFLLICLAAVSGYIRTDEATKGYYTNRLRLLAAAGVGGAGVAIFKMLV
jgi:hypothetical protein